MYRSAAPEARAADRLAPPTSEGRVYAQLRCEVNEASADWPSAGTQAYPTAEQADGLARELLGRGLAACSIGCGEGALEAMLEARGVAVTAVDLDAFADTARWAGTRCFCSEIRRVRPDALYLLPEPATTALCFFWGRGGSTWRQYLRRFPQVPLVVIIGDGAPADEPSATEPRADALLHAGDVGEWRCCQRSPVRAVQRGAVLAVYERAAERADVSGVEEREGEALSDGAGGAS